MPSNKQISKKPSFFSKGADKNTAFDQKIADLCFELLEVPKPSNYSELEKGSALKKVIGSSVNSKNRADIIEKLGEDYFVNYVLVILNMLSQSGMKITKDSKEWDAIKKNFKDLGVLEWFKIDQKLKYKSRVNEAIDKGEFMKIDFPSKVKELEEKVNKAGLVGHYGKTLIYHAITAARADGVYTEGEKKKIAEFAKQLGISDEDFSQLQKLVRIQAKHKNIPVSSLNLSSALKEPTAEEELDALHKEVFPEASGEVTASLKM